MRINKNTIKKNNSYNVVVVNAISKNMGLSRQYVRQCLRGDRNSINADLIRNEYKILVKKIEILLKKY